MLEPRTTNPRVLRLARRAAAALVLGASSLLGAAIGCSSGSECCLATFQGSTTSLCLCGNLDADGVSCEVASSGSGCTVTCTQDNQTVKGTGAAALSSCDGQPIACFNSMGVGTETMCTDSFAACADGHTYELDCTGSSCTCKEDDAVTKTGTGACGDEKTLCGWDLAG
jgi:hypothetical protein